MIRKLFEKGNVFLIICSGRLRLFQSRRRQLRGVPGTRPRADLLSQVMPSGVNASRRQREPTAANKKRQKASHYPACGRNGGHPEIFARISDDLLRDWGVPVRERSEFLRERSHIYRDKVRSVPKKFVPLTTNAKTFANNIRSIGTNVRIVAIKINNLPNDIVRVAKKMNFFAKKFIFFGKN